MKGRVNILFYLVISLFIVFSTGADANPTLSFEDILKIKEITDIAIDRDGSRVAFIMREALQSENKYRLTLYTMATSGVQPAHRLASGEEIGSFAWRPNSADISYWSGASRAVVLATPNGQRPLLALAATPLSFAWSPDGGRAALLVPASDRPAVAPYLSDQLSYETTSNQPTADDPSELIIISAAGKVLCRVSNPGWTRSSSLAWERNGGRLAFSTVELHPDTGSISYTAHVIDAEQCKAETSFVDRESPLFDAAANAIFLVGHAPSLDPQSKFVFATFPHRVFRRDATHEQLLFDATSLEAPSSDPRMEIDRLFLSRGRLIAEAGDRTRYGLWLITNGRAQLIGPSKDRLSHCEVAGDSLLAACVVETTTRPPELGLVDLATGKVRRVTQLNTWVRNRSLGRIKRITVPDDGGKSVTMYLVYPVGYRPGRRYPTIMVLYGFNNGFIGQAQYISSYAPQVYAARGYVTLLWNYPVERGGEKGDLAAQARDLQTAASATIGNAARLLIRNGIADPARIGIAGHSMGSLWADYALRHNAIFAASASHSPGGYTPISYWRSGAWWRRRLDHIFGGPPVGSTLPAWEALSPPLFPPPEIPQLREVGEKEVIPETAYRYWVDAGGPVEMITYPGEGHIFTLPSNRLHSMKLNADWFDFWLRGVRNDMPSEDEQYRRWSRIRKDLCASLPTSHLWYCQHSLRK